MSGLIACYGQRGPQAGGDPRVAELLQRSVEGHNQALTSFDATLAAIQSRGLVPWTASIVELTLLHHQWLALLSWERATVFLDATIVTGELSDISYRQVDMLCDQASQLTLKAISLQAEVAQGKQPGLQKSADLPLIPVAAQNTAAVWASLETIYAKVSMDFALIRRLGVPPRMQEVYQVLTGAFQSKSQVFGFLQKQWATTSAADNKVQIVRESIPLAQHFYLIGQQMWTPYLLGPVYTNIIRSTMLFERLGLGFDPWILTDPSQLVQRVTDIASGRELFAFWQTIADPVSAKVLQDQIAHVVASGQAEVFPGKSYRIAPWQPQYVAREPVTIGQLSVGVGELFTIYPRGIEGGKRELILRSAGRA